MQKEKKEGETHNLALPPSVWHIPLSDRFHRPLLHCSHCRAFDDGHKPIWDAVMSKDSPKCWALNAIKVSAKVDKVDSTMADHSFPFCTICRRVKTSSFPEPCLLFPKSRVSCCDKPV